MELNWLALQIADSAFPAGGFVHSGGLEAAVQHGAVSVGRGLEGFVEGALWQAAHGSLPLVRAAHVASLLDEGTAATACVVRVDGRADAFLTSDVANRASRSQGRAFLDVCARALPAPRVAALREGVRAAGSPRHHAPMFGAVLARLGIDSGASVALFLHLTIRGVLSAAVRLGVIGPGEAQTIHAALHPTLDRVLAAAALVDVDDLAQTSPRFELLAATHERLYSRLFQS